MNLLIDADAVFALTITQDTNHKKALKIVAKNKEATISILNTTVAEVATVLFRKVNHRAALRFLEDLKNGDFLIISVDEKLMNKATAYLGKQKSKDVSFFDCLNMAAMELFNFSMIFSFDKGYSRNGFKLLTT